MTFTLNLTEAEIETISAALEDYENYDNGDMNEEDLIGGTPVLERINSIEQKIIKAWDDHS